MRMVPMAGGDGPEVNRAGREQHDPRPHARGGTPETEGPPAAGPAPVTWLHPVPDEIYPDWEAVYSDNVSRVYRLLFGKVGNHSDAEDLTTEVFLATLRPLRLPAPAAQVRAYLLVTARTALARYWSRRLGQQVTTLTEDVQEVFFSGPQLESLAPQRAQRILSELPDRYRRILQLRFLDACPIAEAAQILGISVANAKVLQHRALRRAAEVADQLGW
jgi:RNA polymerase sigma factor (sigma-70 family)